MLSFCQARFLWQRHVKAVRQTLMTWIAAKFSLNDVRCKKKKSKCPMVMLKTQFHMCFPPISVHCIKVLDNKYVCSLRLNAVVTAHWTITFCHFVLASTQQHHNNCFNGGVCPLRNNEDAARCLCQWLKPVYWNVTFYFLIYFLQFLFMSVLFTWTIFIQNSIIYTYTYLINNTQQ